MTEAHADNETNCNDHADRIARSHRLRIVSNWQANDSITNNPSKGAVPTGA